MKLVADSTPFHYRRKIEITNYKKLFIILENFRYADKNETTLEICQVAVSNLFDFTILHKILG